MARRGKCSCSPKRRGPMTVKVSRYYRTDGTKVKAHKRHVPK
ncbi:hypothetical protein ACFPFV_09315 [Salinicoccus siamensis]